MRTNGIYDVTRGLTMALAAGVAGLLLYLATRVGEETTIRFWESMGLVAAAGLIVALAQVLGSWTKGLRLRVSPSTFLLAFVPVLVCAGWVLLATQPGNGWQEGRIVSWTQGIGLTNVVHDVGLWHGALAFGLGLMLGLSLDTVPEPERERATARRRAAAAATPMDDAAADDPLAAERAAAAAAAPPTVTVGKGRDDSDARTQHRL